MHCTIENWLEQRSASLDHWLPPEDTVLHRVHSMVGPTLLFMCSETSTHKPMFHVLLFAQQTLSQMLEMIKHSKL